MQHAHDTEENSVESDEGLELSEFALELASSEDEVDHLWKANNSRHEPDDHARDKGYGASVLIDCRVQALAHRAKYVGKVV